MIIADSSARPRAPPDGEAEAGAETPAPERVGRTSAGDAPGAPAAGLPRSPALASGEVPAPAEAAEPACGSCPGAPADAEPGTGGISGHADEPDAGRGAAAEAEEEEEAKVEKEQETEVQEEEEEKEKEGEEAAGRKPSVCGTSAPQSRGNAAAGPPAAPGDTETPESGEEFESQFAFRGSEAPSYIKRRADDLLATPTEKAKRFRGYSSDTEYKRIVPSHMQDGIFSTPFPVEGALSPTLRVTLLTLYLPARLNRELLEFVNDPPANITAAPTEDNLYEWQGIIRGPPRTPYEGGTWFIRFQIPETYPYAPPKVRAFYFASETIGTVPRRL
ncbi:MAG: hypothetical protein BJ554DRAFT_4852 [Olpidium bornovanus]|uniref:UBC core domain-containing protein n=1 Tax=Olpidium bornovanus TaxID=278681 RepID=A0A8H7ZKZ6_9FUNG|nr:MAG: hypothetical protein BJ554DRAFT_4852 [Olpidium bornovanus]